MEIPQIILSALEKEGVAKSEILFAAKADMDTDFNIREIWLCLTSDRLYRLLGDAEYPKTKRMKIGRYDPATMLHKKEPISFTTLSFTVYMFSDLESLTVEPLYTVGSLVAKIKDEESVLANFTAGCTPRMSHLSALLERIKKDEKLETHDYIVQGEDEVCPRCNGRYPNPANKLCPRCDKMPSPMLRLVEFIPKYRIYIIGIMICLITSTAAAVISPYLMGSVLYERVLKPSGDIYGQIGYLVLTVFAVRLINIVIAIIQQSLIAKMTTTISYDIKTRLFNSMQRLSLRFFGKRQIGTLMTRINRDANNIWGFFLDGIPYMASNIITLIGVGILLFTLNWRLAIIAYMVLPLLSLAFILVENGFDAMARRFWARSSSLNSTVSDSLNGVRVVRTFGRESDENARFQRASSRLYDAEMMINRRESKVYPILFNLFGVAVLVIWMVGGTQVMNQTLSFGDLTTFIGSLGLLVGPMQFFAYFSNWYSQCYSASQRVYEIFDAQNDLLEAENPVVLDKFKGDIELRGVSFSYEVGKPILKDISLKVAAGQTLGIVGKTGAGKSTLANLILRLYDPEAGEVIIDGHNVKDLSSSTLHEQIAVVSQEIHLFIGSVRENIAYAKPDATDAEILRAAKLAGAHDFIMKLPDGYRTRVGDGGRDLSGGERQRISIARALLRDPAILILDEATASMDTETERKIQEALNQLTVGRTTIIIAHRLSTLRDADFLVVLDRGKIVEEGKHVDLLREKGTYHKLFTLQSEALKVIGVG